MSVTIIGLGPGNIDNLSLGAYRELVSGKKIYCRTKEHPVVDALLEQGIQFEFLDRFYSDYDKFETVYEIICEFIVLCAEKQDLIYCVPGHPYVAETTVAMIEKELERKNIECRVIGSMSFVDAIYQYLKLDPVHGFCLLNAMDFDENKIDTGKSLILTQVYNSWIASEVKLKLMEIYGDEFEIWIVEGALIPNLEKKVKIPLYRLDQIKWKFNHLTSLYIPVQLEKLHYSFYDLVDLIRVAKSAYGYAWDKNRCYNTLEKYLSCKSNELNLSSDNKDIDNLIEELGDVLLLILLCAQNGRETGFFDIFDVIDLLYRNLTLKSIT
ncbi:SAM-dependent methyltransferase [Filifactor alocis]